MNSSEELERRLWRGSAKPTTPQPVLEPSRRVPAGGSAWLTLSPYDPSRLVPSERSIPPGRAWVAKLARYSGIGSDVMNPIAAPILGGMITSTILGLDSRARLLCHDDRTGGGPTWKKLRARSCKKLNSELSSLLIEARRQGMDFNFAELNDARPSLSIFLLRLPKKGLDGLNFRNQDDDSIPVRVPR